VALAGAFNFRDLGGFATVDGRRTRSGLVFRSNSLHDLTPADVARFRDDLRIATIVDLRGPQEIAREGPGPLDGVAVRRLNLPLLDEATDHPGDYVDPGERYRGYLRVAGHNVVAALETMADARSLPLVFHCTAGRDRTGVVAALLLALLGVAPDDIVADYTAGGGADGQMLDFLRRRADFADIGESNPVLDTRPEVMAAFLAELHPGGPTGWAAEAGLNLRTVDRLRDALLERADR
jgi:rhodanese-related sulfurtransferase